MSARAGKGEEAEFAPLYVIETEHKVILKKKHTAERRLEPRVGLLDAGDSS